MGRKVGNQIEELEDIPHRVAAVARQLTGRESGQIAVAEPKPSRRNAVHSADQIQDRRLSRAAGTDHHQELAFSHLERNIPQRLDGDIAHPKNLVYIFKP